MIEYLNMIKDLWILLLMLFIFLNCYLKCELKECKVSKFKKSILYITSNFLIILFLLIPSVLL